jgi:hypothetical protein
VRHVSVPAARSRRSGEPSLRWSDEEVAAGVERQFKSLRKGPKALTAKRVSVLSGIVYRVIADQLEDNPVEKT